MPTDRPPLSVIVPVYNGAATLPRALDSLLGQDIAGLEIIVVDDGSTDASAAVARRHDAAVRCLVQANRGPAAARNSGIAAARGELLSFLDADDRWPEGRARHHLQLMAADPEAELVIGPTRVCRDEPASGGARLPPVPLIQHHVGSATVRRQVFERVGGFDPALRVGEDLDWFRRVIAAATRIRLSRQVALDYHLRPGSLTGGGGEPMRGVLAALHAHLGARRANTLSLREEHGR